MRLAKSTSISTSSMRGSGATVGRRTTTHRVGYEDHQQFDWEIMGGFNGLVRRPLVALTDQGNGLHTGTYTVDTPGSYEFKFRQARRLEHVHRHQLWQFRPNATFTTTSRQRAVALRARSAQRPVAGLHGHCRRRQRRVPEPSSSLLLMLGARWLAFSASRRERKFDLCIGVVARRGSTAHGGADLKLIAADRRRHRGADANGESRQVRAACARIGQLPAVLRLARSSAAVAASTAS